MKSPEMIVRWVDSRNVQHETESEALSAETRISLEELMDNFAAHYGSFEFTDFNNHLLNRPEDRKLLTSWLKEEFPSDFVEQAHSAAESFESLAFINMPSYTGSGGDIRLEFDGEGLNEEWTEIFIRKPAPVIADNPAPLYEGQADSITEINGRTVVCDFKINPPIDDDIPF